MPAPFLHGVEVVNIDDGLRAIRTASTSVIGVVGTAPRADVALFPENTPVLVNSLGAAAALLSGVAGPDGDGTLPDAIDSIFDQANAVVVVIRVAVGADADETMANVIGGVDAGTGALLGCHALLGAASVVGAKPRILIAPGFTHQRPDDIANPGEKLANPVVAELVGIADRLRGTIIMDGPATTNAEAIAAAGDFGSKRVFLVDPRVKKLDATGNVVDAYASACVAGVIARVDNDRGFWTSPSNQEIYGIVGTSRPVDFALGDATSSANLLNENNVATIIREGGFRLWGNRTLSTDPKYAFLCVTRTADVIADSLQAAHLWAVDRGITRNYLIDVREGVNAFLRDLKGKGAILGGECVANADLNTPAAITAGQAYWDFDFTPTYPAERLTFRAHMVDKYIAEIN